MSRHREVPAYLAGRAHVNGRPRERPGSDPLVRQGSFPVPGPIAAVKAVGTPWGYGAALHEVQTAPSVRFERSTRSHATGRELVVNTSIRQRAPTR
jgi:hypothetical protein